MFDSEYFNPEINKLSFYYYTLVHCDMNSCSLRIVWRRQYSCALAPSNAVGGCVVSENEVNFSELCM